MPRMQVYLPDELHGAVKAAGLPVSEILQDALRHELSRREKLAALDEYVAALSAEVGAPSAADREQVDAIMAELHDADVRRAC